MDNLILHNLIDAAREVVKAAKAEVASTREAPHWIGTVYALENAIEAAAPKITGTTTADVTCVTSAPPRLQCERGYYHPEGGPCRRCGVPAYLHG